MLALQGLQYQDFSYCFQYFGLEPWLFLHIFGVSKDYKPYRKRYSDCTGQPVTFNTSVFSAKLANEFCFSFLVVFWT